MAGGEKSIGKTLLLVGFLSYIDLRTQVVILEKIGPPFTSLHGELRVDHRHTDWHTDILTHWHTDWRARHNEKYWKRAQRWDRKVDRIVCRNPPAKWRMHSVTVLQWLYNPMVVHVHVVHEIWQLVPTTPRLLRARHLARWGPFHPEIAGRVISMTTAPEEHKI